ncbi:MAG: endonuclease MutS2, partial [Chloroflexi bacterium]|nr:endonuclease MutS2 [Chloroflexota bacterium]
MHERTAKGLEWDAVKDRLAHHTSFSAGRALALALEPSTDLQEVRRLLEETREARVLLNTRNVHLGGVHDIRPLVDQAERGKILTPQELLDVRSTLQRARLLRQSITRAANQFPNLADWAHQLEPCPHVADEIGQAIDDQGEILDAASPKLARIRRELRESRERVTHTLERMIRNPEIAQYLQEPLITQRGGRYVIPLKADYKGRIPGLIHDQSASGATLFIEPLAVVELGNRVRELELEEEREIRRILADLSNLVAEEAPYIVRTVDVLAYLDLIFAKAKYADEL